MEPYHMTLHLIPSETALILIDFQLGTLALPLTPYDSDGLIATGQRLGSAFAEADATIFTVNVAFSDDGGDRLKQPLDIPMMLPDGAFPPEWSRLTPEIANLPGAKRITKRHWSAFFGTELDIQLRRRGISTVVIGGICTNFGVESTARDAWQHGYNVVIAEDACSSIGEGSHEFAITRTLPRVSRIRKSDAIRVALA
ncbi:isochorismatase family protein [Thalassospira sp.]|uniref:isochorismatase family protein n=1 Tax=Thalassospira sp. TaxID=1912094 RepID=UPI003AA990F5